MPCEGYPSYAYPVPDPKTERMLCGICQRVEDAGLAAKYIAPDRTLSAWWECHKKQDSADRARAAATQQRRKLALAAKKKLTRAELEALGIRDGDE